MTELVMRLQNEIEPSTFSPVGAYDGRANLFSTRQYAFTSKRFDVPWDPPRGGDRKATQKTATVMMTWVKGIDRNIVMKLLRGDRDSVSQGSDAMMTLTMLNIFVQAAPRMQANSLYNTKSFFLSGVRSSRAINVGPFEICRGYYQTVRPTFNKLIVNIDLTVGVVIPARPLRDIFLSYIQERDLRQLSGLRPDHRHFRNLKLFAKGIKFNIELPGHQRHPSHGRKAKEIKELVLDVGDITFMKDDEEISVATHFSRMYNVKLRPGTLGVKTKRGDVFPIDVCVAVPQLYKGRNSPSVIQEAMKAMPQTPRQRLDEIKESWQHLQYSDSTFMRYAGLSVDTSPMLVKGRMLPAPNMKFDGPQGIPHKQPGVWDVMGKRFSDPATIQSWTVVCFAQVHQSIIEGFVQGLSQEMQKHGKRISKPHKIAMRNGQGDVIRALQEEGMEAQASLMLVILPESAEEIRIMVKRFGDVVQGVPTQCVKWTQKRETETKQGRGNQYHNNLILKINTRMGGTNFRPSKQLFQDIPTMVIGADVSHPSPGSSLPSISALVGSYDPSYSRYIAITRVQDPRTEMIADLAEMFDYLLERFYSRLRVVPQRILFYRDGVSEGEFKTVLDVEHAAMKGVFAKKYGAEEKWPELSLIIVGKKHHTRFFPRDRNSEDNRGNGNLRPGFVVDQDIVHPVYSDFYLQSQAGLKGTSRPTHYTVLLMPKGINLDILQEFTFYLCHCYLRSTRSVKLPAPVYCADLVSGRSKFHFNQDTASVTSGGSSFDIDFWKRIYSPLNSRMVYSMYWV
ncbi:hypothetical protein AMATHDRAFT_66435 [Amanita thiersii Skay4041]|uniref:Piwi domain-containing protein n=1 Tax=Amanita thiersii Skay4041 TaxID=703135 RepID=A0A2A9NJN4_9AGAR|nr:hypothetical protein AMATHDRAFT_66435 [Amanita thiersii Skay4041]